MAASSVSWYFDDMNCRALLLTALILAGPALSPTVAQLIHISVDNPTSGLRFKTDDASIPWNTSSAWITQLDFTYDSQAKVGPLDPTRNYWHMRVENPELGRNFDLTHPFQSVSVGERSLEFDDLVLIPNTQFLDVELDLFFNAVMPTDGSLPQLPLPALEKTEFYQSNFSFRSGNYPFNVPHLAEAYGGEPINSITVTLTPIPEPSLYGLAALTVLGAVIGIRRRQLRAEAVKPT